MTRSACRTPSSPTAPSASSTPRSSPRCRSGRPAGARTRAANTALYPRDVKQEEPTLGYHLPALSAEGASGRGTVQTVFPHYTCNPRGETGEQAHRLVPAVPDAAPHATVTATRRGEQISASVQTSGGTGPYTYSWSSSSTAIEADASDDEAIKYERTDRGRQDTEVVTLEVTDANGLTATASVELDGDGTGTGESTPGGGGFGKLAVGPVDVGVENPIDEWSCAHNSVQGFRDVMADHGVGTQFDWRGWSAFEKDFKDDGVGGWDSRYVDDVDAAWIISHGWPGGFTFKSSVDDQWLTPADARWGNRDLEWLQLESCQVLRDTSGTADYFARWRPAFQGLHILNGFDTNAYCVGGTGRRFAEYLFPKKFLWWTLRPALRVRHAWAQMAIDKEPAGVRYRSMGMIGAGGVTNMNDYFWGQGPVGPDIPASPYYGMWAVSGVV